MTDFLQSQYVPVPTMRNSDTSLDVSRQSGNVGALPFGAGPGRGDNAAPAQSVMPIFDSRPFNASDVYFEYMDAINYRVPAGFNMILREVSANSYLDVNATIPFVVPKGLNLSMQVNGVNQILSDPNYGLSSVFTAPVFATIPEGSTLTGSVKANMRLNPKMYNIALTSNIPAASNFLRTAYGSGVFVALSSALTSDVYSLDGITWSLITRPAAGLYGAICYGNGLFMTAPTNMANPLWNILYSTNGIVWTPVGNSPIIAGAVPSFISFGNGVFTLVYSAPGSILGTLVSADNGNTWTNTPAILGAVAKIAGGMGFGNGKYVMVSATAGEIYTSVDGVTWTTIVVAGAVNGFSGVAYGSNGWIAAAKNGGVGASFRSVDGVTWTSVAALPDVPATNATFNGVVYESGVYWVAAGAAGKTSYSIDGVTWFSLTTTVNGYTLSSGNGVVLETFPGAAIAIQSQDQNSVNSGGLKMKYAIRGQLIPSNGKPGNTAVFG